MTLIALGINHQTAPLALRERVAITADRAREALAELAQLPGIRESALLSTCNRTELYCQVEPAAAREPGAWLARFHGMEVTQLDEFLYHHHDVDAVRHVFRVATGLDSLVLGEPQILGQLKDAYQLAREVGTLGAPMDRLFQNSFAVAKRVRTDTRIGTHPVSVAFAAVRLAGQVFADLSRIQVLLVGAGETIELVARHLAQHGMTRLTVVNRTLQNAQTLAERHGGTAAALADLDRHLHGADLVISSTAAREPVITSNAVALALAHKRRPLLLIDLAVPRDIEPTAAKLDDVFLYTVDDLGEVIAENLRSRQEAAREAESIIDLQVEHFMAWWGALDGHGPLRAMRDTAARHRDEVLARARTQLAHGRAPEQVLEFLAHTLTNTLLHTPTVGLREAAERGDRETLRVAGRLFGDIAPTPPADDDAHS